MTLEKKESFYNDYVNGNFSSFNQGIKNCTKKGLLEVIEYLSSCGVKRHEIINHMFLVLEK
jgi:hypothetical protein